MASNETKEGKKLIGFIDLLGTKESSKISEHKFYDAIRKFLYRLVLRLGELPDDSYTIQYLSDSAFLELDVSPQSFEFLRKLRHDLFRERIYFKCSLVLGELKPQNITEQFILDLVENQTLTAIPNFPASVISQNFSGFFFSDQTIKAYLLHEEFKGIGFIAEERLVKENPHEFVSSAYYISDNLASMKKFFDISFDPVFEVGNWIDESELDPLDEPEGQLDSDGYISQFLGGASSASLKKATFAKYYLPTLFSMIRSLDLSSIHLLEKELTGKPLLYRRLVDQLSLRKTTIPQKGQFDVFCAILDEAIRQLNSERDRLNENESRVQEVSDSISALCWEISRLPGFRKSLQHSKSILLSDRSKDILLEEIVP